MSFSSPAGLAISDLVQGDGTSSCKHGQPDRRFGHGNWYCQWLCQTWPLRWILFFFLKRCSGKGRWSSAGYRWPCFFVIMLSRRWWPGDNLGFVLSAAPNHRGMRFDANCSDVKCLHAQVADELSRGGNAIGRQVGWKIWKVVGEAFGGDHFFPIGSPDKVILTCRYLNK